MCMFHTQQLVVALLEQGTDSHTNNGMPLAHTQADAPTCLQTIVAATSLKASLHTVPQTVLCRTSSLPAVVLDLLELTRRSEAAAQGAHGARDVLCPHDSHCPHDSPLQTYTCMRHANSLFHAGVQRGSILLLRAGSGTTGRPVGTSSVGVIMYCTA